MIRIALLVALALFVYGRFDVLWSWVRETANPVALSSAIWRAAFDGDAGNAMPVPVWSPDSSRMRLECPRGLTPGCCESLTGAAPGLCGEAGALLAKARWTGTLRGDVRAALGLEARAFVSDLGDWGYELDAARGRDEAGAYRLRKNAAGQWCDERRGCVRAPRPRAPLAGGRFFAPDGFAPGTALWTARERSVRAVLPGRVMDVTTIDSAAGGTVVRVYHGRELYAFYGPLRAAEGVRAGALVRAGSHLGDAPRRDGGYGLRIALRRAGRPLDPASFWDGALLGALDPFPAPAPPGPVVLLSGGPR